MSSLAGPSSTSTSDTRRSTPAVEVRDLRKDFLRRDRRGRPPGQTEALAGAPGRHVHDRARRVRRHPRPERLGQVDAGPAALHAAAARRRRGAHLRPRRVPRVARDPPAREPRLGRGQLLQEDVRGGEPLLRGAVLRHDAEADARPDPGDPRAGRLPGRPAQRGDGASVARHAAEGRARAGAADVARTPAPRRADDRSRSALQARGAGVHPRGTDRARRDDPALHARHERGRGARRPDRCPRSRRAPVPRAGRGREAPLRRRRRWRRRSSLRRGGRSRPRAKTTKSGRCSDDRGNRDAAPRAGRSGRHRRAQHLSHEALLPVGRRVHGLDDREHPHDRLHRACGGVVRPRRRTRSPPRCSSVR